MCFLPLINFLYDNKVELILALEGAKNLHNPVMVS